MTNMADVMRVGLVGYGNIARGNKIAIEKYPDMNLSWIVSRDPVRVKKEVNDVQIFSMDDLESLVTSHPVDVAILCGGSKKDLPVQGPLCAKLFNTVDSFDTHKHIPPYIDQKLQKQMAGYFSDMNSAALATGHLCAISLGWDPGIFTAIKVMAESFLPGAVAYCFYGLNAEGGVSQGHSDAARKQEGVLDARSYTHAKSKTIERVRKEKNPILTPGDMHWREVFVVPALGADKKRIAYNIKNDREYYKDYNTIVRFISEEEMKKNHSEMPHDGLVIVVGETSPGKRAMMEFKLQLDSNPEFTGHTMTSYARAVCKKYRQGERGALRSCLDFTNAEISPLDYNSLVRKI